MTYATHVLQPSLAATFVDLGGRSIIMAKDPAGENSGCIARAEQLEITRQKLITFKVNARDHCVGLISSSVYLDFQMSLISVYSLVLGEISR